MAALRVLGWIVLIFVVIFLFGLLARSLFIHTPADTITEVTSTTTHELELTWRDELTQRGITYRGQPIEGFDAGLLLSAFPGFIQSDFNTVETLEGHYEFKNGDLTFVRDTSGYVTSAERTLSPKGYDTLLRNVSDRLNITVSDPASLDAVLEKVDTHTTTGPLQMDAGLNEAIEALGVTLVPLAVIEDSRCPTAVQCIQAGTVRVKVKMTDGMGESTEIFTLGEPITGEVVQVTMVDVSPTPVAGEAVDPSKYRFMFRFEKRVPYLGGE